MRASSSILAAALLLVACGGGREAGSGASAGATTGPPSAGASGSAYDLHEWGVIAVRPGGLEVAAGAGQRAQQMAITVDKPVLYVHPEGRAPFDLDVQVSLPSSLAVAEHFPPTDALSPLRWRAHVTPANCQGSYPAASADGELDGRCLGGYCEVYELGTYETREAACLEVRSGEGSQRAPLLFYRLWAPDSAAAPPLPLEVRAEGEALVVRNRGMGSAAGALGQLIRITHDGRAVRASLSPIPARGQEARIGAATGDAAAAHRAMRAAIGAQGLSEAEMEAFDRGWGRALFGAAASTPEALGSSSEQATDEDGADSPVRPSDVLVADDETTLDRLGNADLPAMSPDLPRQRDVLLYWLPSEAIDAFARITATPAPRSLRRAFLVRVALQ